MPCMKMYIACKSLSYLSIITICNCPLQTLLNHSIHLNRPVLNRQKAARWTFGLALVLYIHRFFTHSLVHQMHQPLLFEADFDYTYWLYQASGFAGIFVKTPV